MRTLRVVARRMVLDFRARSMFRISFWLGFLADLSWFITSVVFFHALFRHVPTIQGWTYPRVLILVGTFQVVEGLFQAFFAPNLRRFSMYVRQGSLDRLLLYPVDLQIVLSLGAWSPRGVLSALVGVVLVAQTLPHTGWSWTGREILLYGWGVLLALIMRYAVALAVESLALVWVRVDTLRSLMESFYAYGAYPSEILPNAFWKVFFLFGIPLLWLANVPVEAFRHPGRWLMLSPMPLVYGYISRVVLLRMVRRYEGPG